MPPRPQLNPPASLLERLPEEWVELLAQWQQPKYRVQQLFRWIHQQGVTDPEQMSDLPKELRARLVEAGLGPALAVDRVHASTDGTHKLLLRLHDGRQIESVLIPRGSAAAEGPYASEPEQEPAARPPVTQCVSSQVGCAMGCAFCASGIAGLKRNLTAAEIYAQGLEGRAQLAGRARLAGIVLMGMGEPLHNYEAVARALVLFNHKQGFGLSLRRVTLSTSGLVDGIERLGRDFGGQVGLAISLHAVDDDTRSRIMPINQRHPLRELLPALKRYPLPPHRMLTVEYTLLAGINDSLADARELCRMLRGLRAKVNLIPMNSVAGTTLHAPEPRAVDAFQRILSEGGLDVFVRRRKGDDIAAACGQLALLGERPKVKNLFRVL